MVGDDFAGSIAATYKVKEFGTGRHRFDNKARSGGLPWPLVAAAAVAVTHSGYEIYGLGELMVMG